MFRKADLERQGYKLTPSSNSKEEKTKEHQYFHSSNCKTTGYQAIEELKVAQLN